MELLSLFKSNGLQRFLPVAAPTRALGSSLAQENAWSAASGMTGYQMRFRVGDVLRAGYVEMTYKGRVLLGQFKSFEWSANAESPYRWDFNFTFRVATDFTPYFMGV